MPEARRPSLASGRERVRHLERRHPDLEPAEDQRRVVGLELARRRSSTRTGGREVRLDPHLLGGRGDVRRAHLGAELGVDRVVRVGRRRGERGRAEVAVLVVGGLEEVRDGLLELAVLCPLLHLERDLLRRRGEHLLGRAALLERGDQGERLERGAGLAVPVGRQVERLLLEVVAADHRPDPGVGVVQDHDRGGGLDARRARLAAIPSTSRWKSRSSVDVTSQPPGERLARAVVVDELLAQPGREVRGLGVLGRGRDPRTGRGSAPAVYSRTLARDVPLLGHLLEHQVAPLERRLGVRPRRVGAGRGDDRRPASPPPRAGAGRRRLPASSAPRRSPGGPARCRSRSWRPPRSRTRPRRSRSSSGTR